MRKLPHAHRGAVLSSLLYGCWPREEPQNALKLRVPGCATEPSRVQHVEWRVYSTGLPDLVAIAVARWYLCDVFYKLVIYRPTFSKGDDRTSYDINNHAADAGFSIAPGTTT